MSEEYNPPQHVDCLAVTIRREVFTNDKWLSLNDSQRLLFILMLSHTDSKGNSRYDDNYPWVTIKTSDIMFDHAAPGLIKARITSIYSDFMAIVGTGLVTLHESERGYRYYHIENHRQIGGVQTPYRR